MANRQVRLPSQGRERNSLKTEELRRKADSVGGETNHPLIGKRNLVSNGATSEMDSGTKFQLLGMKLGAHPSRKDQESHEYNVPKD